MEILSTNILTNKQRKLLVGYKVIESSLIEISFLRNIEIKEKIKNAIFTSKNAVKSVFEINKNQIEYFEKVYCVGKKTATLLTEKGINPILIKNSAKKLAMALIKTKDKYVFFCGNTRRDELLNTLTENHIKIKEIEVYKTELTPIYYTKNFEAVLFFSPTGVQSYVIGKNTCESKAICIGETTANAAKKYFKNTFVANEQSIESVLSKLKEIIPNQ